MRCKLINANANIVIYTRICGWCIVIGSRVKHATVDALVLTAIFVPSPPPTVLRLYRPRELMAVLYRTESVSLNDLCSMSAVAMPPMRSMPERKDSEVSCVWNTITNPITYLQAETLVRHSFIH